MYLFCVELLVLEQCQQVNRLIFYRTKNTDKCMTSCAIKTIYTKDSTYFLHLKRNSQNACTSTRAIHNAPSTQCTALTRFLYKFDNFREDDKIPLRMSTSTVWWGSRCNNLQCSNHKIGWLGIHTTIWCGSSTNWLLVTSEFCSAACSSAPLGMSCSSYILCNKHAGRYLVRMISPRENMCEITLMSINH